MSRKRLLAAYETGRGNGNEQVLDRRLDDIFEFFGWLTLLHKKQSG